MPFKFYKIFNKNNGIIIIILIVCLTEFCEAQTRNFWLMNDYNALIFDSQQVKVKPFLSGGSDNTSICDSLGNLVFYTSLDTVFNSTNLPLVNGNLKFNSDAFKKSICLNYAAKKYAIIAQGPSQPGGIYYFTQIHIYYIDMSYNNGQGRIESIDSTITGRYIFHDVIFNQISKEFLLTFTNQVKKGETRFLYLGKLNNSNLISIMDSINTNQTDTLLGVRINKAVFNNKANSIGNWSRDSLYFINYDFDIATLKFKQLIRRTNKIKYSNIGYFIFSPNDSFIYATYGSTGFDGILQYNIYTDQEFYTDTNFFLSRNFRNVLYLWLLPDNKIYITITKGGTKYALCRILNPDLPLDTNKMEFDSVKLVTYRSSNMHDHETIQRVDFGIDVTCSGLNFYNRCDPGFYNQFIWYLNNDSFIQTTPHTDRWNNTPLHISWKLLPSKTGKYYINFKAVKNNGFTMYASDSIFIIARPLAKFKTAVSQGCQYVAYTFSDSSYSDTVSGSGYSWHYYFGDSKDTLISSKITIPKLKVKHTYTSSGIFNVRLIFSNGFCSDTFDYVNFVNILPAPKPGFTATSSNFCGTPVVFTLKSLTTIDVVRYFFDMGNSDTISSTNATINYTYNTPGTYKIKQHVQGTTGCITEDSLTVIIRKGLTKNDTVEVLYTTVIDSVTTKTIWKSLPYASKYIVNTGKSTIDTFYVDKKANPNELSQKYFVGAIDSCGNSATTAPVAQTIRLKALNYNFNEYALLEYTPYETWQYGVLEYRIEYFNKYSNEWLPISAVAPSILTFKTEVVPSAGVIPNNAPEICYRVIAYEQNGNRQISISNEACIDVYPIVFIPTAFSPNNDGLNDYYKPVCAGLSTYIFEIYDRWGELIYTDSPESKGWDGTFRGRPLNPGLFIFRLAANSYLNSSVTNGARVIEKKGTITLVR